MNWLKRKLQAWLEIKPAPQVQQHIHIEGSKDDVLTRKQLEMVQQRNTHRFRERLL